MSSVRRGILNKTFREIHRVLEGRPLLRALAAMPFDPLLDILIAGKSGGNKNDFFSEALGEILGVAGSCRFARRR